MKIINILLLWSFFKCGPVSKQEKIYSTRTYLEIHSGVKINTTLTEYSFEQSDDSITDNSEFEVTFKMISNLPKLSKLKIDLYLFISHSLLISLSFSLI